MLTVEAKGTYAVASELFNAVECARLLEMLETGAQVPGRIWNGTVEEGMIEPESRNVAITHEVPDHENAWVFDRIRRCFHEGAAVFGVEESLIVKSVTLAKYSTGCHFKQWHKDSEDAAAIGHRLLSVSVQLTDPTGYCGGNLEIYPYTVGDVLRRASGDAIVFRSSTYHRVTPVTAGVRCALVAWAERA